jgi:acylphosphatase
MAETGVRVRITGRVQGVWYRGWTVRQAETRGLAGWVRNRSDGSVEAVFVGSDDAVEAMIEACRSGPPAARVDDIKVEPLGAAERAAVGAGFLQRPTE